MTGPLAHLGATLPVVAAPMAGGPSRPQLVMAAARAGATGFLAAGYKTAAELEAQIVEVSQQTRRFGVNLFVPNKVAITAEQLCRYRDAVERWLQEYSTAVARTGNGTVPDWLAGVELPDQISTDAEDAWSQKLEVLEAHPVPLISLTFGLPAIEDIARLQSTGAKVLVTVIGLAEARQAEAAGADAVIVQSSAAGGHSGTWTPSQEPSTEDLTELLEVIRSEVGLPLWAAGGISTPEAVRDVLLAGAQAAVVGTVLLRSPESGTHQVHRQALADADPERETVVTTAFSGRPARALPNAFTEALTMEAPLGFPCLHFLTAGLRRAFAAGADPAGVNLWAGTGFAHAWEEPAGDILRRLSSASPPWSD